MTDDRELLVLAARAAAMDAVWDELSMAMRLIDKRSSNWSLWRPLHDDGDALRLAVKLGMLIDGRYTKPETIRYNRVSFWPTPDKDESIDFGDYEMDPYAATRRAIVMAAAAIGRRS